MLVIVTSSLTLKMNKEKVTCLHRMSILMFMAIQMFQIWLEPQGASEWRKFCVIARAKTMYHFTRHSQDNSNEASLKELTTAKPLSARQSSEKAQKRVKLRRELEEAKEQKQANLDFPWW